MAFFNLKISDWGLRQILSSNLFVILLDVESHASQRRKRLRKHSKMRTLLLVL